MVDSLTQEAAGTFPRQKVPKSKKTDEWYKSTVDHIISRSNFNTSWKRNLFDLYEAYNGRINESTYRYVTNPYNTNNQNFTRFPAKMRNYNIIKPAIDLLLGEKRNRPINWQVIAKNADSFSEYEKYLADLHMKNIENLMVRDLMQYQGVPPEQLPQVLSEKEVDTLAQTSYKDRRAIMGQEAMDYLWEELDLKEKYQLGFFHWLVSGETYTYRDVVHDEVVQEIVSPVDLDYAQTQGLEYIEDADWVVRRMYCSANELVDKFYDVEGFQELIDELESPIENRTSGFFLPFLQQINNNTDIRNNNQAIETLHVTWKGFDKYGLLTYDNGFGVETKMVSEEYVLQPDLGDISIEWMWVTRFYECWKIDGKHYIKKQPIPIQRNQITNFSKCKGPYNGRVYSRVHSENISVVMIGLAYQVLYNIVHYRMELSIAKNKDKIILMEHNAIPKSHGWTEDKFMYYADAMGFAFIDTLSATNGKSLTSFNQYQVLDASMGQYIAQSYDLLTAIKTEWEEMVGLNRQRKGQQSSSDGLGVSQEAIYRSSVITEELFAKFDKFMECDCQGILDYSKQAWRGTKKERYIRSDGSVALLEISEDYPESMFGIFFKNSNKEHEKLQTLKQLSVAFAQQGSTPSTVAEILDSNNFAKVKEDLRKLEQQAQAIEQQKSEAQNNAIVQAEQIKSQESDLNRRHESSENNLQRIHEVELKLIDVDLALAKQESDVRMNSESISAGNTSSSDVEKSAIERLKLLAEDNRKRIELSLKNRELDLKEKDIDVKRENNIRDNKTKLKNPTSGEKK